MSEVAADPDYSLRSDNKRKFDDGEHAAPPSQRRSTGFSAPILDVNSNNNGDRDREGCAPPPSSYNTVPPPQMKDEFEIAKQKAQELAARFMASANQAAVAPPLEGQAKRLRLDDSSNYSNDDRSGVNGDHGHSFADGSLNRSQSFGAMPQAAPSSVQSGPGYGFQYSTQRIDVPVTKVGLIIGKGGETIKYLQHQSGAKMQVTRDSNIDPHSLTRQIEMSGTPEQLERAQQLINDLIKEADAGNVTNPARGVYGNTQPGTEQVQIKVPNNRVGLIIGKGGESIKNMQSKSGARIQLIPLHLPPGDTSTERNVHITGTRKQIEHAQQLITEIVNSENRMRGPPMPGGYNQQGYRAPRPPPQWGPPGPPPMQQQGYGYQQSAPYPGPPQQYASQPYGTYSQQMPTGQSSGWDQRPTAPAQNQQGETQDPYGQQGQSAGGSANSSYAYGHPQSAGYGQGGSYGQNYSQQGYGQQNYGQDGYASQGQSHNAYPQPANSSQGFDQQGYSSQGYGLPGAPQSSLPQTATQDGSGSQFYGTSQSASQQGHGQPVPSPQPYSQQSPATSGYQQPSYGSSGAANPNYGQGSAQQLYMQQGASNVTPYGQGPTGTPYGQNPAPNYGQHGSSQTAYGQQVVPQSGYGQQTGSSQPAYGQQTQSPYPQQGIAPASYGQQGSATQDYSQTAAQSSYPQQQDSSQPAYS